MNRCVTPLSSSTRRRVALAALLAGACAAQLPLPASAQQVQRRFPQAALRGKIVFTNPPDIELNGDPARLSPGVRIHGFDNMMVVTGAVGGDGNKYVVDYRLEGTGLVSEVWLLTKTEAAVGPWPSTPAQAAAWTFDFMAQTWTKP
jgi:hypothetical protein